ncbi:hypothetical protein [Pseudomonas aeruginosa]|uniref:hypothetical protein n=1 Tax=Pseudomonas aeruginosa TaxID=287 RepID=UPI000EB5D9CD|nr:hypothetical protein [Pseudomonas aeruginosa]
MDNQEALDLFQLPSINVEETQPSTIRWAIISLYSEDASSDESLDAIIIHVAPTYEEAEKVVSQLSLESPGKHHACELKMSELRRFEQTFGACIRQESIQFLISKHWLSAE